MSRGSVGGMSERTPSFENSRPPVKQSPAKPARYRDHLAPARLILLLVAIGVSVLPALSGRAKESPGEYTLAYVLWGVWLVLGIVAIIQKASWKQRNG